MKLILGKYTFDLSKKTLMMGILNVTPDSFSDGGNYVTVDSALKHAKKLKYDGADIIDIGAESTRPGSVPVSLEEEKKRLLPVVERLVKEVDLPISIDTYKAEVALEAINLGAHMINDVWGGKKDKKILKVAAQKQVPIILMHNRVTPVYKCFMEEVVEDLRASISAALQEGVLRHNILVDPGIGFAKDLKQNYLLMRNLKKIVKLGYPVVLGTSRKSFIGKTLNLEVNDRLEGTLATVSLGVFSGCHIMRVHDVKEVSRACKMLDVILHV